MLRASGNDRPAQSASDHGRHHPRPVRTGPISATCRGGRPEHRRSNGPACPIRPQRHRRTAHDPAAAPVRIFLGPHPLDDRGRGRAIRRGRPLGGFRRHRRDVADQCRRRLFRGEECRRCDPGAETTAGTQRACPPRWKMDQSAGARPRAGRPHRRQAGQHRAGGCRGREGRLRFDRSIGTDRRIPAGRQEGGRRSLFRLHRAPGRDGGDPSPPPA